MRAEVIFEKCAKVRWETALRTDTGHWIKVYTYPRTDKNTNETHFVTSTYTPCMPLCTLPPSHWRRTGFTRTSRTREGARFSHCAVVGSVQREGDFWNKKREEE